MSEIKQLSEVVEYKTKQKTERVLSWTLTQRTTWLTLAYSHHYLSTIEDFVLNSEWYYMQLLITFILFKAFLINILAKLFCLKFCGYFSSLGESEKTQTKPENPCAARSFINLKQHWHPEADKVNCRLVLSEAFWNFSTSRLKIGFFRKLSDFSNQNEKSVGTARKKHIQMLISAESTINLLV